MKRYQRSPFLLINLDKDGKLVLTECNSFHQFRVSPPILALLQKLTYPMTLDELSQSLTEYPKSLLDRLLLQLCNAKIVLENEQPDYEQASRYWTLFELAMQRQTSFGGVRAQRLDTPAPPAFKRVESREVVPLPRSEYTSSQNLTAVLNQRKSMRTYSDSALSLVELAQFLYSCARVKEVTGPPDNQRSTRPYAGGGGRHTLELYLLCDNVSGLRRALYYYHPLEHVLYLLREPDERYADILRIVRANAAGTPNRNPCVVIHITSVFGRMMWKYERLSLATIYRDVGRLYQTMYLVATDMHLAPCAIAGIQDIDNAAWMGLDPLEEAQVGCFLLGK